MSEGKGREGTFACEVSSLSRSFGFAQQLGTLRA